MKKCKNCKKQIKEKLLFCSRSCSATYNNIKFPKRFKSKKCMGCLCLISSGRKYCLDCNKEGKHLKNGMRIENKTLKEHLNNLKYGGTKYVGIRTDARRKLKNLPQICEVKGCNYSHFVEACHIRPINNFPLSTKISEINSKENLKLLCPNHHWDLDHGLLNWHAK